MSLTTFMDIPRSALAMLLDAVGQPKSMSPRLLMGDPATPDPHLVAWLYGGKFINIPESSDVTLTPEFVKVARVLLDPRTNVTIRIWGNENMAGETNIQFPRDIMTGGGVILNQIGRMYRISAFVDESTITGLLKDGIPQPQERDLQFDFKAHLDNKMAAVMFAIVDLARRKVQSTKRLVPLVEMVFPAQDVYSFMYDRWALTGFKDMITYVTAVGIMTEAPSLQETLDSLKVLAQAGFLKEVGKDRFGLTKGLEPMVRLTLGQPSGMQWQRISLLDNGEQFINNRTFVFCDKTFMLCFAPTVKGRMYISKTTWKEIRDFLAAEIASTLVVPDIEPEAPKAETKTPVLEPPPTLPARPQHDKTPPPLAAKPKNIQQATPPPGKIAAKPAPQVPPAARPAQRPIQQQTPPVARPATPPVQPARPAAQPRPAQQQPTIKQTPAAPGPAVKPVQPPVQPARPVARPTPPPVQPVPPVARPTPPPVQPSRPASQPAPSAAQAACTNCGAPLAPNIKFCAKCGAPVAAARPAPAQTRPAQAVCVNCGAPLKPGAKFCAKCGAVVGAPAQARGNMCPNCGQPLKPGVKFCASCGTRT